MVARALKAHIWDKEANGHYVEPRWCSERLFEVEQFLPRRIVDPCCGFGHILVAADLAGYQIHGNDIVDRGFPDTAVADFFTADWRCSNIVCNPPFEVFKDFALKALEVATTKVAMISLIRTLPAARWLKDTPLARVHLLTPRPSMPPGYTIAAGQKPGGGTQDFCWLVWEHDHRGAPELRWLHRDATPAAEPSP